MYVGTFYVGSFLVAVLLLEKCYDNKMVKVTPHLGHPTIDQASGG